MGGFARHRVLSRTSTGKAEVLRRSHDGTDTRDVADMLPVKGSITALPSTPDAHEALRLSRGSE